MLFDIALASACVLWGGLTLRRWALRSRRADRHLVCRGCGHDLHGKPWQSQDCPECGTRLADPRNLQVGNRARRPLAHGVSVALIVLAVAAPLYAFVRVVTTDWQKSKPVWVLKIEAVRGGTNTKRAAIDELVRRHTARELFPGELADFVPDLLAIHADPATPWSEPLGDLIQRLRSFRQVTDEQWVGYARNYIGASVRVFPRLEPGAPVVVELSLLPRGGYSEPFELIAEVELTCEAADGTTVSLGSSAVRPVLRLPPLASAGPATPSHMLLPIGLTDGARARLAQLAGSERGGTATPVTVIATVSIHLVDRDPPVQGKREYDRGGNLRDLPGVSAVGSAAVLVGLGPPPPPPGDVALGAAFGYSDLRGLPWLRILLAHATEFPRNAEADFALLLRTGEVIPLGILPGLPGSAASPHTRRVPLDAPMAARNLVLNQYTVPGTHRAIPPGTDLLVRPVMLDTLECLPEDTSFLLPRRLNLPEPRQAQADKPTAGF